MRSSLIKILTTTSIAECYRLIQMHVSQLSLEALGYLHNKNEISDIVAEYQLRQLTRDDAISLCAQLEFLSTKNATDSLFVKVCSQLRDILLHRLARPEVGIELDDIDYWRKQIEPFLSSHDATKLNMLPASMHQFSQYKLPAEIKRKHTVLTLSPAISKEIQQLFNKVRRYDETIRLLLLEIESRVAAMMASATALENQLSSIREKVESEEKLFMESQYQQNTNKDKPNTELAIINDILFGKVSFQNLLNAITEKQLIAAERGIQQHDLQEIKHQHEALQQYIVSVYKKLAPEPSNWGINIGRLFQKTIHNVNMNFRNSNPFTSSTHPSANETRHSTSNSTSSEHKNFQTV